MGRYCGEDYGEPRVAETLDFLNHLDALAKREELNARYGGGFVIIRASIFYRVIRGAGASLILADPPKCCGRWMYTQRDGTRICLNHRPAQKAAP